MALELDIENLILAYSQDRYGKLITHLIAALVAKGWTVEGSGDGLAAFQNSGQTAGPYNVFTSGLGYFVGAIPWAPGIGGANSISNPRAWVRLKEPAPSTREFIFQRSSASTVGYDCYMIIALAYAGFLAGGASANTPPTSAGTTQFLNGTAFNNIAAAWGNYAIPQSIACHDTLVANVLISDAVRAGNVWPFQMIVFNSTLHALHMAWMYESLSFAAAADADPLVVSTGLPSVVFDTPTTVLDVTYNGREAGVAVSTLTPLHPRYGGAVVYGAAVPARSQDNKTRSFEVDVVNSTSGAYKGRMDHFMYNFERLDYPKVCGLATADPKVYVGGYMLDWATNITPGT